MTPQTNIKNEIITFYQNHDTPIRRDDKEKLHNIVNFYSNFMNDYKTITHAISYIEQIREERVR